MTALRDKHLRIQMPMHQVGLNTTAARALAPEQSLFLMQNAFVDLKGALRKLPASTNYSTFLREPSAPVGNNSEIISKVLAIKANKWELDETNSAEGYLDISGKQELVFHAPVPATALEYLEATYALEEGETYNSEAGHNGSFSFGFTLRATGMSELGSVAAHHAGVYLQAGVTEDEFFEIGIFGGRVTGCYSSATTGYSGVTFNLVDELAGLDLNDNMHHTFTLRKEAAGGDNSFYLDIDDLYTITFSHFADVPDWQWASANKWCNIRVYNTSDHTGTIDASLSNLFVRDTDTGGAMAARINHITTSARVIPESRRTEYANYAVTDNAIWRSIDFNSAWTYFAPLEFGGVRASAFRGRTIIYDVGSSLESNLWEISSNGDLRVLGDAPPIRFGTEHLSRFIGGGDPRYPLRLYYSAIRDPNVWFAPDYDEDGQESEDEVLDAGWIEINGDDDEKLTGFYGNFYSSLVICTNKSTYLLSGYNTATYQVNKLSDSVGALNQDCIVKVNNDLVCVGVNGIDYLKGSDTYGDVITNKISAGIQDIFSLTGNELRKMNADAAEDRAQVVFYRQSGLLMFAYPKVGEVENTSMVVFNVSTQQWNGPWTIATTCLNSITTGYPLRESIAFAGLDGQIKVLGPFMDMDAQVVLESQVLDGRSAEPLLQGMVKQWGQLRLTANPGGIWPVVVEWKTETGPWKSETIHLGHPKARSLGVDARLGKCNLISSESSIMVPIDLDCRGVNLKFRITTSASVLSLLHAEVDFTASGYERN